MRSSVTQSPRLIAQRKKMDSFQKPIQKKENKTGLPDQLKSGIENLSGLDMSDTSVHYNSSKPAQLHAHAYAQGNQIHVAPGQEKHVPHEAWHVVQQKQGRVQPTMQMKGKVNINDDAVLEKEADVMGAKALITKEKLVSVKPSSVTQQKTRVENKTHTLQLVAWNPEWTEAMDDNGKLVLKETLGKHTDTNDISDDKLRELREYLITLNPQAI